MSNNEKILVVDDDKFNVTLMRELCETAGYSVIEAHDGTEAVNLTQSEKPDLLLLDIMMAGKNGFEVCQELRSKEETAGIPIIIVTALDDLDSKMRGIELGADDYITKPFRLFEVQRRIRTALDTRRYRRQLEEAHERLKKLGEIDTPGRIGGYRQLRNGMEYEFKRAQRYEHALSCVLFGIAEYDSVLNTQGKKVAASMISAVVTVFKNTLRAVDRIYRVDYDQFIFLLPETPSVGARKAVERIRKALKEPSKEGALSIAFTAALVCYPHPEIKTGQDILWNVNNLYKQSGDKAGTRLIELDS
ncbi:MAG: response regulator [Deltaproteobacteria bacterium]|nr:response regulator [Deltaproteobacteria bacterium]